METVPPKNATECRNPATGEIIGYSPVTSPEELIEIIHHAKVAQECWAKVPVKKRAKYVLKIRDYLEAHGEEIAQVIHSDNGKTCIDAMTTGVLASAIAANYYAKNASRFLKPKRLQPGSIILTYKQGTLYRVPFGVIGIISPWNYPFTIPFHEVIIGLLAGNTIVLKTATDTQMVGRKLEECINAAGLPEHVFNYVNLSGSLAGKTMLENGIDKLFFTGGTDTGSKIMQKAAETLTPVALELGSNDAMIVCEDADLVRASGGAIWAGLQNSGQSCGGVERIYVHEKIHDDFLAILKSQVASLQIGPDLGFEADLGVMTTEEQVRTVKAQLEDALSRGARIVVESKTPKSNVPENYFPGMILTDVTHEMEIMKHETFGPVIGIMRYSTEDEAVALANDSNLGLSSSVWSKDRKRADRIAKRIESGAVMINDHLLSHGMAETPWGGFKQSGIGRTHGELGFHEMTEPQVIIHDRLPFVKRDLWWHPYSEKVYDGIRALLHLLYGKRLSTKIKSAWTVFKFVPRIFRKWLPDENRTHSNR